MKQWSQHFTTIQKHYHLPQQVNEIRIISHDLKVWNKVGNSFQNWAQALFQHQQILQIQLKGFLQIFLYKERFWFIILIKTSNASNNRLLSLILFTIKIFAFRPWKFYQLCKSECRSGERKWNYSLS